MAARERFTPVGAGGEAKKPKPEGSRIPADKVEELISLNLLDRFAGFLEQKGNEPFSMENLRQGYLGALKNVNAVKALLTALGGFRFEEKRTGGDHSGQNRRDAVLENREVYQAGMARLREKVEQLQAAKAIQDPQKEKPKGSSLPSKPKPAAADLRAAAEKKPLTLAITERAQEAKFLAGGELVFKRKPLYGKKLSVGEEVRVSGDFFGEYIGKVLGFVIKNEAADMADVTVKFVRNYIKPAK